MDGTLGAKLLDQELCEAGKAIGGRGKSFGSPWMLQEASY